MIAVDTNVLIRVITDDEPEQADRATSLLRTTPVLVSLTVILETEWVLRSRLGFSAERVVEALLSLDRVPTITFEQRARVRRALGWTLTGVEFADALHLASAKDCQSLASFDRRFRKRAARVGAKPPVVEP